MTEEQLKKVDAEIAKIMAETEKINAKTKWYHIFITSGIFLLALIIVKLFM